MKPEELQIGDIVDVHRCECVADGGHFQEWNEYGKVVSITENYITIKYIGREEDYDFEDVNEEDINPIPLTDKILEQNGFERVNGEYQDVFYIYDGIELLIDNVYTLFGQCKMPIKYVHELQHAMRLCGINKEIEI